uniref:Uncharacterized protein n=1 Tax=Heterorhabditis bacteriophora TaxID=37862 RepID=A0A1I7WC39_HETBA
MTAFEERGANLLDYILGSECLCNFRSSIFLSKNCENCSARDVK